MTDTTTPSTSKKKRPLLRFLAIALLLLVLLVVLAPTILSMGLARGFARDAIAKQVQGTVDVGAVSVGWLSEQSVENLSIRDADGSNSIKVNVHVRRGLLALITTGVDAIEVSVAGDIAGTIRKDGTIGFADLLQAPSGGSSAPSSKPSTPSGGASSPIVAKLLLDGLSITLKDERSQRSYAFDGLKGSALYDGTQGSIDATIESPTTFSGAKGSIALTAKASQFTGALDKIVADLTVKAANLRVPAGDREADFTAIDLRVSTPQLGQSATVTAKAEGRVDGAASTLLVDLTTTSPITASGAVEVTPANLKGSIEASNLPTSLAQPMLAATSVQLAEDVGPLIERCLIKLPGGEAPISLEFKSAKAELAAGANVDATSGAVRQGTLDGTVELSAETLKRLGKVDVTGTSRWAMKGSGLSWTPVKDAPPLNGLVGQITLSPLTPTTWTDEAKGIAATLGPATTVQFGRGSATELFVLDLKAALSLGVFASPPAAPEAPSVALRVPVDAALTKVENATLAADLPIDPGFLRATTGRQFSQVTRLKANVRELNAPLKLDGIAGIGIDADVRIDGSTAVFVDAVNRDVPMRDIVLTARGADLTKQVDITLAGVVDTASIDVRETVRDLPKDLATLDPLAVNAGGVIKISGINSAGLLAWLPEQKSLIEAADVKNLSIDLVNEPLQGKAGQRVSITIDGQPIKGAVAADIERDAGRIEKLELAGTIGAALVSALQSASESPVVLASDAPFNFSLARPTAFTFAELREGKLPAGLAAQLSAPLIAIAKAPGLAEPLNLKGINATVNVDPSATSATAKGSFQATGVQPAEQINSANFDLAWAKVDGPSLLKGLTGTIRVAGINVPWVERLIGKSPGLVSNWTGDEGTISLTLNRDAGGERIQLVPEFPRIANGTVDVVANGERVVASAQGVAVRIPSAKLDEIMTKPGAPADAPRYGFEGDLAITLTASTVELPKGLATSGDTLEGASVNLGMKLAPIGVRVMRQASPTETLTVPALDATLASKDLGKGITLSASTDPAQTQGASIKITGGIRDLKNAEGAFSADAAVVDFEADVQQLPTVLLDLVAASGGSMSRALGDQLSMKANAKSLSKTSGQLTASLTTPYVNLEIPQVAINKGGVVRITEQKPITATFAMSPGIKEDLLYQINTIFADVDLVKERASLTITDVRYPLDGNLAKFDAEIRLDIGDVKMRNGRPVSLIFMLLENKPVPGSEARIEPLDIKIVNGQLRYDKFSLLLFKAETAEGAPAEYKNRIDMKGDVDLTKKHVNFITTRIPLSQFANYSGDVTSVLQSLGGRDSDVAQNAFVGIKLSGPLYDSDGKFKPLEQSIDLPKPQDLLTPGAIGNVLKNLGGDKASDAPAGAAPAGTAPAKEGEKKPTPKKPAEKGSENDAPKDNKKEKAKDAPKDGKKDKPKDGAKEKDPSKEKPKKPANE